MLVALVLRVGWITLATRTPSGTFNDAAAYLQISTGLSYRVLPTLAGRASAFYAPGYPILLSPFVYGARKTGLLTPAEVASIVNAIAGTITVAVTALLARRWLGPRARNPAAWLMALAPAHVFFTPTAHGETVFAALFVSLVLWFTVLVDRSRSDGAALRTRSLLLYGALAAFAALVRGPGLLLLAVPVLVLLARRVPRAASLRAMAWVTVGLVAGLVPWTIVNGVHAGVWTPISTQNATAFCVGHHELGDGRFPLTAMPEQMASDCYRYSPFDDPALDLAGPTWQYSGVDEARWYHQSTLHGVSWAVTHPLRELWLTKEKMVEAWSSEWDALPAGRNFEETDWTGRATAPLNGLANGWLYLVEAMAVLGLVVSQACRRAMPIWGTVLLVSLTLVAGVSQPHFRHVAIPFLVILAGGLVAAVGPNGRRSVDRRTQEAVPVP